MKIPELTPQQLEEWKNRFNEKWTIDQHTGCWLWTASLAGKGYGQMKIPGTRQQEYAHRIAWTLFVGKIPEGVSVLHRCDTPRCVNWKRDLFLGSDKDNAQDMKAKGRHLYGERNPCHVLYESEVAEIKLALAAHIPQHKIAKMFGVSQITISRISTGKRWAHVPDWDEPTRKKS